MKGLICIDIDGTLTAVRDAVHSDVVCYLGKLVEEGYQILFVTGRTFFWSMHLLHAMPFSFYLAVLNGAYVVHMPTHTLVAKQYLSDTLLKKASSYLQHVDVGIVLYTGPESGEKSYFCAQYASKVIVKHLEARAFALQETWERLATIKALPPGLYAALRAFCLPHTAIGLSKELEASLPIHAPMMTDSYDKRFSVVQVTHAEVSKGHALDAVKMQLGRGGPVIACGDDYNDMSMLEKADFAVVMSSAPGSVLALADVIAPSAEEKGLIHGLESVIRLLA